MDQFISVANNTTISHEHRTSQLISTAKLWFDELQSAQKELLRLRSKVTKLKVKLGAGKNKTAALRHLHNLRKQKLQQLELSHDLEDQLEEETMLHQDKQVAAATATATTTTTMQQESHGEVKC